MAIYSSVPTSPSSLSSASSSSSPSSSSSIHADVHHPLFHRALETPTFLPFKASHKRELGSIFINRLSQYMLVFASRSCTHRWRILWVCTVLRLFRPFFVATKILRDVDSIASFNVEFSSTYLLQTRQLTIKCSFEYPIDMQHDSACLLS